MNVTITEVIRRSDQGITRPFLCVGEDGRRYYVKGHGAGRRAMIAEWLAGRAGRLLDLPIPEFVQALIPQEIVDFTARSDITDLGAGVGFGSTLVDGVDELSYSFIDQVDAGLQARVLLFDRWIANGDRTLTENGGNPNLLWSHQEERLHVIDHNLAFDDTELGELRSRHIFAASHVEWTESFRTEMTDRMRAACEALPDWWNEMPPAWLEIEAGLALEDASSFLSRFEREPAKFWRAE